MNILVYCQIILSLLDIFMHHYAGADNHQIKCISDWSSSSSGRVAFSLYPCFTCTYSTFQRAMTIKWDCEQAYNLKIKGTMDSTPIEELPNNELRIIGSRENISNSTTVLSASHITSHGMASIHLTLKLIAHPSTDKQSKLQLYFQPVLNKDEMSFNHFLLFWHSLKKTEFTVFIYNRTHIIQHETSTTSICLENLTEGSSYKLCVTETTYACKSSYWNCIIKTIPTFKQQQQQHQSLLPSTTDSSSFPQTLSTIHQPIINNLKLISSGGNWVQISWLPSIALAKSQRANQIPYAYILLAISKSRSVQCYDRIYSIQAPWAHHLQSNLIAYIHKVYHRISTSCLVSEIHKAIDTLGNSWPELTTFNYQKHQISIEDEWGSSLNEEYIVNLERLIPQEEYEIKVLPVFEESNPVEAEIIMTGKLNPSLDCNLTLEDIFVDRSVIKWNLPPTIKSKLLNTENIMYVVQISFIGRPEKKLQQTCFISTCPYTNSSQTLNFLPQMENEPQRLNCLKAEIPFLKDNSFIVNCQLQPCKVYEISVAILQQNKYVEEFKCKRRFMRNGSPPEPPKNAYATPLAQNVILLEMDKPKSSTFHQCGVAGYAVSIYPEKENFNVWPNNYALIEMKDLQMIQQPSSTYDHHITSTRQHFFISNPHILAKHISVRIHSIPFNGKNWIDLSIPLLSTDCHLDCVWQNQPLYYQVAQRSYPYSGQHMSYITLHQPSSTLQISHCPRATDTTVDHNQNHRGLCQYALHLQTSEYTVCRDENSFVQTCFVPSCDQMAPIPCVTIDKQSFQSNSSTIQVAWNILPSLQRDTLSNFKNDEMEIDAYLVILYDLNESKDKYKMCAQYKFVVVSKDRLENWKNYFHDLLVQSLIDSCLGQTVHSLASSKAENTVIFQNLLPSTLYEVNIIPFNKFGKPGAGQTQRVTTTIAMPCEPKEIEIYKTESHAFSIKWKLQNRVYCGNPSRVILYYKLMKSSGNTEEWSFIDTEYVLDHIRLSSLLPCQRYCVKLKFENTAGSSKLSSIVCNTTKRAAFTNIPALTAEVVDINSSTLRTKFYPLMLRLRIHLNYTSYCPVKYEFHSNIYNVEEKPTVTIASNPEVFLTKNIQRGFLYQIRGRVRSNESVYSPTLHDEMNVFKFSQWTPLTLVFVNISEYNLVNFTVSAKRPIEIQRRDGSSYYTCQSTSTDSKMNYTSTQTLEYTHSSRLLPTQYFNKSILYKNSYCLQIAWNISGSLQGLLGFVIQFFLPVGQNLQEYQQLDHDHDSDDDDGDGEVDSRGTMSVKALREDQSAVELQKCAQFIWLPCFECLKNYSIKNAHPRVLEKLRKLIDGCKVYQPIERNNNALRKNPLSSNSNISSDIYSEVIYNSKDLEKQLKILQLHHFNRIMLNQTVYSFQYHIRNPLVMLPSLTMKSQFSHKKRVFRSNSPNLMLLSGDPKLVDTSSQNTGYAILYSVTADDVIYKIKHKWQLYDKIPSSSFTGTTLVFLILSGIVLVLLCFLIVTFIIFNRGRVKNRQQFTKTERVDYYCEDEDDEAGYELREEYKLPIIPLKISKQPDAIYVHDFVNLFGDCSTSQKTKLREEFKLLDMYSYKQEQAKRLTYSIGQNPENRLRNKYRNLLPFDHNYVQLTKAISLTESEYTSTLNQSKESLTHAKDNNVNTDEVFEMIPDIGKEQLIPSNYMNASWIPSKIPRIPNILIDSGQLPQKYIAAQAPVNHSRSLFWQMIWDHRVSLIVTLTRCMENGKEKCSVYWPTNNSLKEENDDKNEPIAYFGRYRIHLISEMSYSVYVYRKLRLYSRETPDRGHRDIIQLHMLKWPDFSVPTTEDFLTFLYAYWTERRMLGGKFPVLVHCSAGIGRTGTFICLDQLCQLARHFLHPNFHPVISKINRINEPVYMNLNNEDDDDDDDGDDKDEEGDPDRDGHQEMKSLVKHKENIDQLNDDKESSIHDRLLNETLNESVKSNSQEYSPPYMHDYSHIKKKSFVFGKRRTQCIDIFKTVLWLRSQRNRMVQTTEQYIFIYECLAHFIKQLKEQDEIYENI
ncbi:unnamed protein product [Trichobilharzia szidati]|nr:unnamed protein product [Trichobilharzia szidati]